MKDEHGLCLRREASVEISSLLEELAKAHADIERRDKEIAELKSFLGIHTPIECPECGANLMLNGVVRRLESELARAREQTLR